jgi:hypothetical protein
VLDGHVVGNIFTDSPEEPTWAVLQEATFGSIYMAGYSRLLHQLVASLRQTGTF